MVVVAPEPTGAPRPGTDRGRARRGRAGGHVVGVVVDLPGRAPQRVVGGVRPKHARLDAGDLDDVPDRLIVPVEVVREPRTGAGAGAAFAGCHEALDPVPVVGPAVRWPRDSRRR